MQVCEAFPNSEEHNNCNIAVVQDVQDLQNALKSLSIDFLDRFELDEILADGHELAKIRTSRTRAKSGNNCETSKISVAYLIAGSELLRTAILSLRSNSAFCALVGTKLGAILSEAQLKTISNNAIEFQSCRNGTVVYSTSDKDIQWFVLVSGKLRANVMPLMEISNDITYGVDSAEGVATQNPSHDIIEGDIFGGIPSIVGEIQGFQVSVEVSSPCTWFMLRSDDLLELMSHDVEAAEKVLSSIEGVVFVHSIDVIEY